MTRSLARTALELFTLGFAPAARRAHAQAGFSGTWKGRANLPVSMNILAIDLRLIVRANARTSCNARITLPGDRATRVRGRGCIYASGRCCNWEDDPARPRIIVHTIARISRLAAQVTFDLYLPDGSELFGYATLRDVSLAPETAF